MKNFFGRIQYLFRWIIAAIIGTLNLIGIAASCWMTQTTPFRHALTDFTALLTTPQRLGWLRLIPADYIPGGYTLLNAINHSDAIAAILLSTLTTAILTLLLFMLLLADLPRLFAQRINGWQAKQAIRQIEQLDEALQRIDLYALPPEEASALMARLELTYRQTLQRSRFNALCSLTPFPTA